MLYEHCSNDYFYFQGKLVWGDKMIIPVGENIRFYVFLFLEIQMMTSDVSL